MVVLSLAPERLGALAIDDTNYRISIYYRRQFKEPQSKIQSTLQLRKSFYLTQYSAIITVVAR